MYIVFPTNVAYYRRDDDDECDGVPGGLWRPAKVLVSVDIHIGVSDERRVHVDSYESVSYGFNHEKLATSFRQVFTYCHGDGRPFGRLSAGMRRLRTS